MDYQVLLDLMIKVALLVASGYVLKKTGVLTEALEKGLSGIILKFVLPCSVIASASGDFGGGRMLNFLWMAGIAFAYYPISIFVCRCLCRLGKFEDKKGRIILSTIVFANTAFIGYPICQELFGNEGFVYAVIYNAFYQMFFFTFGINYIRGSKETNLFSILVTPVNIALVIMFVLIGLQIKLPLPLQDTLSSVGNMMVPLSMLVIGCSLVGMKPAQMLADKSCYLISVMRLLVFPLLAFIVVRLMRVPEPVATIGVLLSGVPSGSMNVIIAKEYDCEPEFSARAVVQTMVLSVATLPLWVYICSVF